MSRLEDIEARITALEDAAGNSLKERIIALEELLGLKPSHDGFADRPTNTVHCDRCGMDQNPQEFKCAQAKCPLK